MFYYDDNGVAKVQIKQLQTFCHTKHEQTEQKATK